MEECAIIIVNYNTPWHLKKCIDSVFLNSDNFHLFLVNNAPQQESLNLSASLEKKYANKITVINHSKNLGFVAGVNSVYSLANKYYRVCFLNSDVVVTKGWLSELNRALDENSNAVQVAPDFNHYYPERKLILYLSKIGLLFSKKFSDWIFLQSLNFNPPKSAVLSDFERANHFFQFCSGACNLARIEPFQKRGYFFDPKIIHGYGDDFDTSLYLREFGDIGVTNKAYVFHFLNTSFKKLADKSSTLKTRLMFLNQLYVINKWKEKIKEELKKINIEQLVSFQGDPHLALILNILAILDNFTETDSFIKNLPALETAGQMGIMPE